MSNSESSNNAQEGYQSPEAGIKSKEERLKSYKDDAEILAGSAFDSDEFDKNSSDIKSHGADGMFGDLNTNDISGRKSIEGYAKKYGVVGGYMKRVSKQVENLLTKSSEEFTGTEIDSMNIVSDGNLFNDLERKAVSLEYKDVLANIDNVSKNKNLSLASVELMQATTAATKEKTMSELQFMKGANEEAVKSRLWFREYALNNWVSRKSGLQKLYDRKSARFKKTWIGKRLDKRGKVEQTQEILEKKLQEKFAGMEAKLNTLENTARSNEKLLTGYINGKFDKANTNEEHSTLLNELSGIIEKVQSNGDVVSAITSSKFEIKKDQIPVFLSAIKNIVDIRGTLISTGQSKKVDNEREEISESLKKQQDLIEKTGDYKFEEVLTELNNIKGFKKDAVSKPSMAELVSDLSYEFDVNPGLALVNKEDDIRIDLMTDQYRLIKMITKLSKTPDFIKKLDKKVAAKLKIWIQETYSGNTVMKESEVTDAQEKAATKESNRLFDGANSIYKLANNALVELKTHSDTGAASVTAFNKFKTDYGTDLIEYNKNKSTLGTADKAVLDAEWEKVEALFDKFELFEGKQRTINAKNTQRKNDINTASLAVINFKGTKHTGTTNTTANGTSTGSAVTVDFQKAIDYQTKCENVPIIASSNLIDFGVVQQEINKKLSKKVSLKKVNGSDETVNQVLRREFLEEFSKDPKVKEGLVEIEKRDQFDLISKCARGTSVKIDYLYNNDVKDLRLPNQLKSNKDGKFYVNKVVEKDGKKTVFLINEDGDNMLVMNGAALKDGKMTQNWSLRKIKNPKGRNAVGKYNDPEVTGANIFIAPTSVRINQV